jgi:hypothetical protein
MGRESDIALVAELVRIIDKIFYHWRNLPMKKLYLAILLVILLTLGLTAVATA